MKDKIEGLLAKTLIIVWTFASIVCFFAYSHHITPYPNQSSTVSKTEKPAQDKLNSKLGEYADIATAVRPVLPMETISTAKLK